MVFINCLFCKEKNLPKLSRNLFREINCGGCKRRYVASAILIMAGLEQWCAEKLSKFVEAENKRGFIPEFNSGNIKIFADMISI